VNHSEIVSFLWGVADLIRDTFKRGKYQDVILPLTVLRRLDCVLAPTKEKVLKRQAELRGKGLQDLDAELRKASGFAFYNTSRYDFEKLLADAPHLAANLRNYIAGFSLNMREVLEKFDFDNTISKLDEAGLLFQVLERFKNVDLHPDKIDNPTMGTIFEELIRKFNEALNENPGEHFTPRDVVHLMVDLMMAGDEAHIRAKGVVRTVYDPCCGSGGMLTITKEHITIGLRKNGNIVRPPINPGAEIHLFGEEVNPETWAVSKSDLFMKDPTGRDADNVAYGSTLANDRHAGRSFDYLIANPPYGKDWKRDEDAVRAEHVDAFFEREVKPHVPDVWIDTARRDEKDGDVGLVGYEINFNRYFYRYTPPRPLEEIEADIRAIEKDIMRMLAEVTGNTPGSVDGEPA
jgi:type I restriction enzyme M protein